MSTTKKAAKKPAKKPAAAKVALTTEEQAQEAADRISNDLSELEATVTQREWLLVCNKLDRNREQIHKDGSLRLLALAFVRQKREHGGANWDRLLDCTDAELLELHGYAIENPAAAEQDDQGDDQADQGDDQE